MSYESWDLIADLYNPLLLLCALIIAVASIYQNRNLNTVWSTLIRLTLYMGGVYGLLALDSLLRIWPALDLDYSTHTSFAAACCWFLWRHLKKVLRIFMVGSLMAYLVLMDHQRYHTVGDMVSTLLVIALWLAIVDQLVRRVRTDSVNSSQTPRRARNPNSNHP